MTIHPGHKARVRLGLSQCSPLIQTLVERRLTLGLSQAKLAATLGVTSGAICYWESERSSPGLPGLQSWADALGLELHATPKESAS